MADTIQVQHSASGATLYVIIRDADGLVYNGGTFEAYLTANLGTYDIPMTEQGTASRYYTVAMPLVLWGLYSVVAFVQAGGAPAETDTIVGSAEGEWDAHAWTRLGEPNGVSLAADIADVKVDTAAILVDTGTTLDGKIDAIDNFVDTEVADILVDTSTTLDDLVDDLETRLTAALATKLAAHGAAVLTCTLDAGSSATAVVLLTVEGTTPSAVDDFYNGAVLVLTSGALAGQRTSITDYVGATKTLTVVALTGAPAAAVTGIIC